MNWYKNIKTSQEAEPIAAEPMAAVPSVGQPDPAKEQIAQVVDNTNAQAITVLNQVNQEVGMMATELNEFVTSTNTRIGNINGWVQQVSVELQKVGGELGNV